MILVPSTSTTYYGLRSNFSDPRGMWSDPRYLVGGPTICLRKPHYKPPTSGSLSIPTCVIASDQLESLAPSLLGCIRFTLRHNHTDPHTHSSSANRDSFALLIPPERPSTLFKTAYNPHKTGQITLKVFDSLSSSSEDALHPIPSPPFLLIFWQPVILFFGSKGLQIYHSFS